MPIRWSLGAAISFVTGSPDLTRGHLCPIASFDQRFDRLMELMNSNVERVVDRR